MDSMSMARLAHMLGSPSTALGCRNLALGQNCGTEWVDTLPLGQGFRGHSGMFG